MRGRGVKVKVILLHVLAVIALVAGEAEGAFFQDWIAPVPHGQRKAQALMFVANTTHAVFVPAVGASTRLIVIEVFPRRSPRAVVLAHRAPCTLGEVGTPEAPVLLAFVLRFEPLP